MHERAVMRQLVRRVVEVAGEENADAVTAIRVRLGALSHFTPEHFREHFLDAARGTPAEGAAVDAVVSTDRTAAHADGVVLENVELEVSP
ncbi:MAG TPA: hydrogenase maturation nickel metallochaperone HypA [Gaiellaceae bacterium]|nr:hydrogenase maturation nickel metallochaperone HypA [Gaiellaceae bacterium]